MRTRPPPTASRALPRRTMRPTSSASCRSTRIAARARRTATRAPRSPPRSSGTVASAGSTPPAPDRGADEDPQAREDADDRECDRPVHRPLRHPLDRRLDRTAGGVGPYEPAVRVRVGQRGLAQLLAVHRRPPAGVGALPHDEPERLRRARDPDLRLRPTGRRDDQLGRRRVGRRGARYRPARRPRRSSSTPRRRTRRPSASRFTSNPARSPRACLHTCAPRAQRHLGHAVPVQLTSASGWSASASAVVPTTRAGTGWPSIVIRSSRQSTGKAVGHPHRRNTGHPELGDPDRHRDVALAVPLACRHRAHVQHLHRELGAGRSAGTETGAATTESGSARSLTGGTSTSRALRCRSAPRSWSAPSGDRRRPAAGPGGRA